MTFKIRTLAVPLLPLALLAPGLAAADCASQAASSGPEHGTLVLRSDNDLYGRANQDQGYSAAITAAWVSPDLDDFGTDACLPAGVRWVNRSLSWLQPRAADQRNMVFSLHHAVYTPTDGTRADLIADDRPYAGVLMLGLGWNGRRGDRLSTTHLRLGMTGPSGLGEAAQDSIHQLFGRKRFKGWDNQLRDEVLVQLLHERLRRWHRRDYGDAMAWDITGHAGASLGNLATYANGGVELRWGKHLPDDFGTDPFRPAGDNRSPGPKPDLGKAWGWHFFVGLDSRWVFHDVTLDGNTWKDSHSVDRREAVTDLSFGLALTRGPWKIAGSHVRRSREFVGQDVRPVFGSLTISRTF